MVVMPPKPAPQQSGTKPKSKNKDNCLVCKATCKDVPANKQGSLRCSVCLYWYHPDCAGVSQEEFKMCIKWKELKGGDIWTCSPCTSANENLDKMVREVNSKVEEVKKDLQVLSEKQGQAEVREQLRDNKVDTQAAELEALKERMAKMEASSGNSVLKEIDERKLRENNVIIHRLPEPRGVTAADKREDDLNKVQDLVDSIGIEINIRNSTKFSRRQGKQNEEAELSRPLLVGFKYQGDQEYLLANTWKLAKDRQTAGVSVVRDLTDKERKRERDLMSEAKGKNLDRTSEEVSKNLVFKIVGERGRRREILVPLRDGEVIDRDGSVVETEHRVGGGRTSWRRAGRSGNGSS